MTETENEPHLQPKVACSEEHHLSQVQQQGGAEHHQYRRRRGSYDRRSQLKQEESKNNRSDDTDLRQHTQGKKALLGRRTDRQAPDRIALNLLCHPLGTQTETDSGERMFGNAVHRLTHLPTPRSVEA